MGQSLRRADVCNNAARFQKISYFPKNTLKGTYRRGKDDHIRTSHAVSNIVLNPRGHTQTTGLAAGKSSVTETNSLHAWHRPQDRQTHRRPQKPHSDYTYLT
jgi:hypothetical protein